MAIIIIYLSQNRHAYFMINPEDLKNHHIKALQAATINTEVKKLHVKSL